MTQESEVQAVDPSNPTLQEQSDAMDKSAAAQEVEAGVELTTGEEAPSDRPEWLDEKFESPEDMAKAYQELQSKMGKDEPEGLEIPTEEAIKEDATPEQASAIEDASKSFAETGEIDDKSYEALAKSGISREVVDQFKANATAAQELQAMKAQQAEQQVFETVGGKEIYTQMSTWAGANLTDGEQNAYNEAVNSGDIDKVNLAVSGLYSKYSNNNSMPPNGQLKGMSAPQGIVAYNSQADMMNDMRNPQYASNPTFRSKVEKRLAISQF
jgi:hypothetical protein